MASSPQVQQQQETVAWVQHIERCFARHPLILRGQSIANFIDANYQSSTIGCATTHLDYLDDLGLPQVHQYLQDKLDLTTMHYVVLFFNKSTPSNRPVLAQHQNQSLGAVAKKGVLVRDLQALRDITPRYVRLLYLSQPEDMVGGELGFQEDYYPEQDQQYIYEHSFQLIIPKPGKVVTFNGDLIHTVFPYQSQLPYPQNSRNSLSIEVYQLDDSVLAQLAECAIIANDTDKIRLGKPYSINADLLGGDTGLHLHRQLQQQPKRTESYSQGRLAEVLCQPVLELLADPQLQTFYTPLAATHNQGTWQCSISTDNQDRYAAFQYLDQACFQLVTSVIQDPASCIGALLEQDGIQDSGYQLYQIHPDQWLFFGTLQQQQGDLVYRLDQPAQHRGFELLMGLDATADKPLEVHFVHFQDTVSLSFKDYLVIPNHPVWAYYLHNPNTRPTQLVSTQITASSPEKTDLEHQKPPDPSKAMDLMSPMMANINPQLNHNGFAHTVNELDSPTQ